MIHLVVIAVQHLLAGASGHSVEGDDEINETLSRIRRGLNALKYHEAKRYWLASHCCLAMVPPDKDLVDYASEAFGAGRVR